MKITHWSAIVEWDGPCHSPETAAKLAESNGWGESRDGETDGGLYCALGRPKKFSFRPNRFSFLYLGQNKQFTQAGEPVVQTLAQRIRSNKTLRSTKTKGGKINGRREFWIGHIETPAIQQPLSPNATNRDDVGITERVLLYTIRPLLDYQPDAQKKPKFSFVVKNQIRSSVRSDDRKHFLALMPHIVTFTNEDQHFYWAPFEKAGFDDHLADDRKPNPKWHAWYNFWRQRATDDKEVLDLRKEVLPR